MTTTDEEQTSWETETGLVHDVDAWIRNSRFGQREEYAQKVAESGSEGGLMYLCDLEDESGQIIATQGWSVGTGWVPSDDSSEISHPKRNNVVGSCMYGQLQNRVVRELHVNMQGRGLPTQATSWDGLGFHWMQEEHATVGGETRTGLMPVLFLSEKKAGAPAPAATQAGVKPVVKAPAVGDALTTKLSKMAAVMDDVTAFQKAALTVEGVAANDALMSEILDDGPEGFYTKHHGG